MQAGSRTQLRAARPPWWLALVLTLRWSPVTGPPQPALAQIRGSSVITTSNQLTAYGSVQAVRRELVTSIVGEPATTMPSSFPASPPLLDSGFPSHRLTGAWTFRLSYASREKS